MCIGAADRCGRDHLENDRGGIPAAKISIMPTVRDQPERAEPDHRKRDAEGSEARPPWLAGIARIHTLGG